MSRIPIALPALLTSEDVPRFEQWLVDEGIRVLSGDRIAEVVTDGMLVYVVAPADGMLHHGSVRRRETLTGQSVLGMIVVDESEFPAD